MAAGIQLSVEVKTFCSKLKQEGMKLSQIAGILDLSDCTCRRIFLNITAVIQWKIRYILAAKRLPVEGTTTGLRYCHWLSDSKSSPKPRSKLAEQTRMRAPERLDCGEIRDAGVKGCVAVNKPLMEKNR